MPTTVRRISTFVLRTNTEHFSLVLRWLRRTLEPATLALVDVVTLRC